MSAENKLIDGSLLARHLMADIERSWVSRAASSPPPCLAIIHIGDNHASTVYINRKIKACKKIGFHAHCHAFPNDSRQAIIAEKIQALNKDPHVHGILLQLPLPKHLNGAELLAMIHPDKDVDGIGPHAMGQLIGGAPTILPCTTAAVLTLLDATSIPLAGKTVSMIGASSLVGKPTAIALINAHATVTVCHSQTVSLRQYVQSAEILIVAIGNPHVIHPEWIKPGSIVIDVGINRTMNNAIVGDIDTSAVIDKVQFITPVPGGVGPLTVAHLVGNLFHLYCLSHEKT